MPTSGKRIKAGFMVFAANQAQPKVLALQFNPETLTRNIQCAPLAGAGGAAATQALNTAVTAGQAVAQPPAPHEVISFTTVLDASEPSPDGSDLGVTLIEMFAAILDLLTYYQDSIANEAMLFSFGTRLLPVRMLEVRVVEQAFDAALHPVRAEIQITLQVLNHPELCHSPRAKRYWEDCLERKQQLADGLYKSGSLEMLGIRKV